MTVPPESDLPDALAPADAGVLVVEDNVPDFVQIARLLAQMGVTRCEWKTSTWQLIQFINTSPPFDLILLDLSDPRREACETLTRLRDHPRLHGARIVAIESRNDQVQIRDVELAGFDGLLLKPLDSQTFPDQLRRMLAGEPVWESK